MENPNGKISVIIVNYNAGKTLVDCISSVINHVDEIVIADNTSVDDSLKSVENFFSDSPKLHIIRNSDNLGFAKACNIGYRISSGTSILFLNPDCILEPDTVELLNHCLRSDAAIGMVGGLILNEDGSEQAGGRRMIPTPLSSITRAFGLSWLSVRYPLIFPDFNLHKQPLPDSPTGVEAISGSCMLVKKSALEDVGLLDESYFMHCEDLDWCMRFRQNGWKILFVPEAKVLHHKGTCSISRPIFVEWHKHKGMIRFYHKFFQDQYPRVLMGLVTVTVWMRFGAVTVYHGVRQVARRLGVLRG